MKAQTSYKMCKKLMNRNVLIKSKHGTYRGKIVKVSKEKVYLKVNGYNPGGKKARVSFFFFNPIIPLVLFDLLVIVLLDRPKRRFYF